MVYHFDTRYCNALHCVTVTQLALHCVTVPRYTALHCVTVTRYVSVTRYTALL